MADFEIFSVKNYENANSNFIKNNDIIISLASNGLLFTIIYFLTIYDL